MRSSIDFAIMAQKRQHRRNYNEPGHAHELTFSYYKGFIHMNPVRRGLVDKPEEWKWSSAIWYLGHGESPIISDPIPSEWLEDS